MRNSNRLGEFYKKYEKLRKVWSFSYASQSDMALAQFPYMLFQITQEKLRYSLLSEVYTKLGQVLYYACRILINFNQKVNNFNLWLMHWTIVIIFFMVN